MTTVADFGEYTGVNGVVTVGGVALADVEYDIRWSRSTVSHSRASKYSDIQIPGKLSVKTTIKKMLVHAEAAKVLGYSLTDAGVSGTATVCLAETSFTAGTAVAITSDPATVSVLAVETTTAATTLAGSFTIIGTDANDQEISETITVPAATPSGTVYFTSKAFKLANWAVTQGITGSAKFKITGVLGTGTYTVHDPKIFDLIGGVVKGGDSITITQPDCWFTEGGISFKDAGTILEMSSAVEMHDPDLMTMVVVTA